MEFNVMFLVVFMSLLQDPIVSFPHYQYNIIHLLLQFLLCG